MFRDRHRFANFFFGWDLDTVRTRIIFYTVLDVQGRNIQRFGNSLIHYPRWVEKGYENELMRLTDFINSLHISKREQLVELTRLKPMRPSESLLHDLWDLARGRMFFYNFYRKYCGKVGLDEEK